MASRSRRSAKVDRKARLNKKLETIKRDQEIKEKSEKAPLKSYTLLQEGLEEICSSATDTSTKKTTATTPSIIDKSTNNRQRLLVTSSKGRRSTLKEERLQFKKVITHPVFKNRPLEAIQTHIKESLKRADAK